MSKTRPPHVSRRRAGRTDSSPARPLDRRTHVVSPRPRLPLTLSLTGNKLPVSLTGNKLTPSLTGSKLPVSLTGNDLTESPTGNNFYLSC